MISLHDPALALAADVVDDLEHTRTANENRLRQMTRDEPDADGVMRGLGLSPEHPDVRRFELIVNSLRDLETEAVKQLQRQMVRHPLGPWVKAQKGVGMKQAARLLAAIGDPFVNSSTNEPRTVSQLWAYSGYHVIKTPVFDNESETDDTLTITLTTAEPTEYVGLAARRRKGVKSNWSTNAKTRAYLIAESCVKQLTGACKVDVLDDEDGTTIVGFRVEHGAACNCSPYRVVYDERKRHTQETHAEDWTDGHRHQDALRVTAKRILRDLWRVARDLHGEAGEDVPTEQTPPDSTA